VKTAGILKGPFFLPSLFAVLILLLPFLFSNYYVGLATQIFIMAIFAMSLDVLVGHTGLPSMGHAA
jgi:branched-chain amino acid transport system permease protein